MRPFTLLCLSLAALAAAAEEKIVIWKLDDVKAGEKKRLAPGFKRVADWAKAEKTVVTMGVICDSLAQPNAEDVAWLKANAVENGGVVEFWHHGWDHRSFRNDKGEQASEFKGPDLATQTKHLKDACEIFHRTTGLTFHAFGAPFNQSDETTAIALNAVPEITVWMYGPKSDQKRQVLGRSLNLETATGKVGYEEFAKAYAAKKPTGLLLLQGHCGMWDDASFKGFTQAAELLKKDGWITLTTAQYAERTAAKTAAPAKK